MGSIKLNPKDAERYGTPERIEFNLADLGVRQRAAVEKACKRPLKWMFNALSGVPELDENGNAIPVPVFDDEGNQVFEDDGVTPKMEPKLWRDPEALAMFVYLILWGAGFRTDWDTFDIYESGLEIQSDSDEDEPSEGKDEAPAGTTDSASTTSE